MKATHLPGHRARRIFAGVATGLGFASLAIAQSPPPAAGATSDLEEIVVRGVRRSVEKAQEVKREALQVTDSVVAEDIGKLPDNSVAEALSRITGVQINRLRADASATLIRGLPNVVTTLNGREIFTTRERGIALADIPADLLQRVSVYKSNSPEHLAGGIAGTIDVALRRPLDFDRLAGAVSLRGVYSDQAESTSPVGSALISNRWDTDAGTFGALFAVSYQDIDFLEQNTFNGTYDAVPNPSDPAQTILRPFVIGAIDTLGDHARTSANASFQWQPNDNAELHFDAFYIKYDEDFALNFWIPLPGITGDSATLKPDSNVVQTWHSTDIFTLTSNQAFKRESHTEQYAFGGKFTLGGATTLRSELAWTRSTANNRGVILDTGFIAPQMDVDFSVGGASSALIRNADGSAFDVTDSSHYWMEQIFDQRDDQSGDEISLTADLNHSLDGFFSSLDAGVQLSRRTADSNAANGGGVQRNRFAPPGVDNLIFVDDVEGLTGVAGIQDVSPKGMLDDDRDIATDQWFIANREFLLDHTDVLRELFLIPDTSPPPNDPANFFDDEEKTNAIYTQAKFDANLGSLPFDGVFGVRYVRTESELTGTQVSTVGGVPVLTPIAIDKTDTDLLPSINARLKFQDDLHLRLALFKTITRPNFRDLNPQRVLTAPGPTLPGQGFGGNPNLDNVEAKSADLSLEWYFSPGSLFSTTIFYRDIKGYIQTFVTPETINGQVFQVSRPESSGSGDMKGAEFAYTQFFDKLPGFWSGFGAQLNYTMIDAKADTVSGDDQDLTNVSDSSYNAILMYENKVVSGRLAYNWRSDYVESYNQSGAQPTAVRVKPISTLDFSLGFNVNDHVTIAFDAVNLLDRPLFNYFGGGSASSEDARLYNRDVRSNDTRYSLGVRMRL
jgi:TonB-dependent receptor